MHTFAEVDFWSVASTSKRREEIAFVFWDSELFNSYLYTWKKTTAALPLWKKGEQRDRQNMAFFSDLNRNSF